MKGLNVAMEDAVTYGILGLINVGTRGLIMSHLLYVDDPMLCL